MFAAPLSSPLEIWMIFSIYEQNDGTWEVSHVGEETPTSAWSVTTLHFYPMNSGRVIEVTVNLMDLSISNLPELVAVLEKLSTKIKRYVDSTRVQNKA